MKVIEKTLPDQLESFRSWRGVLGFVPLSGAHYKPGYRFDFLRGDPTPKRPMGVKLPVDAYYPDLSLVLEFRESQHYSDRVPFWDNRITATGERRKEQRQKYDKRREDVLPAHGIRLLIFYDYELAGNSEVDQQRVKQRLIDLEISV